MQNFLSALYFNMNIFVTCLSFVVLLASALYALAMFTATPQERCYLKPFAWGPWLLFTMPALSWMIYQIVLLVKSFF